MVFSRSTPRNGFAGSYGSSVFSFKNFVHLWLCLGFVPAYGLSLAAVSRAILVVMHRLLIVVASLVVEHRLQGMWASVFAAYGLSSHISWVLECGLSSCEAQA